MKIPSTIPPGTTVLSKWWASLTDLQGLRCYIIIPPKNNRKGITMPYSHHVSTNKNVGSQNQQELKLYNETWDVKPCDISSSSFCLKFFPPMLSPSISFHHFLCVDFYINSSPPRESPATKRLPFFATSAAD